MMRAYQINHVVSRFGLRDYFNILKKFAIILNVAMLSLHLQLQKRCNLFCLMLAVRIRRTLPKIGYRILELLDVRQVYY